MLNIYLPGLSAKNAEEQKAIVKAISKKDWKVYSRSWDHWYDNTLEFDLEREVQLLEQVLKSMKNEEVVIIAKSIGTLVAIQLTNKISNNRIKSLLLFAPPIQGYSDAQLQQLIADISKISSYIKIVVHEDDLISPVEELKKIKSSTEVDLEIIPGSGHGYQEIDYIIKEIEPLNI